MIDWKKMKTADQLNAEKAEIINQQKISELESQITQRNIRSATLGDQHAINHITNIENQIASLR